MMLQTVSHSSTSLLYKKLVCYFLHDVGLIHDSYNHVLFRNCALVHIRSMSNEAFVNSDLFVTLITHNQHTFL